MEQEFLVPIDGQLLALLAPVGLPVADPSVDLPFLQTGADGTCSIVVRVRGGVYDKANLELERRYQLGPLGEDEASFISSGVAQTVQDPEFRVHSQKAIARLATGDSLETRRLQRVLQGVTQFCGPRMSQIVFLIYKEAFEQGTQTPRLDTHKLLEALGHQIRGKLRDFDPNIRSQLAQDILTMHRTEIVFEAVAPARSGKKGKKDVAVLYRNILRIKRAIYRDRPNEELDFETMGDLTFQLPDEYEVELGFFDEQDTILLSLPNRGTPRRELNESRGYASRCLNYLLGRYVWDKQSTWHVRKSILLQKSGILGANSTRNNQLLQQALDELVEQGYLKEAAIYRKVGAKQDSVRIIPNTAKMVRTDKLVRVTQHLSEQLELNVESSV